MSLVRIDEPPFSGEGDLATAPIALCQSLQLGPFDVKEVHPNGRSQNRREPARESSRIASNVNSDEMFAMCHFRCNFPSSTSGDETATAGFRSKGDHMEFANMAS